MEKMHTPEPWRTAERSGFPFHIDDARGESVAVMLADDDHDEQRGLDNAHRIVACVNACAGIPNEQLECDNVEFVRIFNERNTLKQQRDELQEEVNALKERAEYDLAEFARTLDISYDEIKLLKKQLDRLLAALIPFGAIDLVESRLPAEFAMLVLRARAAIASVKCGAE